MKKLFISSFTLGFLIAIAYHYRSDAKAILGWKENHPEKNKIERLASVLRGIKIEKDSAKNLGLEEGYYKVDEFQINTTQSAHRRGIALRTAAVPNEKLNPSKTKWFFTNEKQNDYSTKRWDYRGQDTQGNTLEFSINFKPKNTGCTSQGYEVEKAALNGQPVKITTQSIFLQSFNTCGFSSEPKFSINNSDN